MTNWRLPAVRRREQVQEVRAGRSYEVRTAVAAAILTAGSFTCAARNSGSRASTI